MTGEILMHPPCVVTIIGASPEENITAGQKNNQTISVEK
jgi:hypothetical protein